MSSLSFSAKCGPPAPPSPPPLALRIKAWTSLPEPSKQAFKQSSLPAKKARAIWSSPSYTSIFLRKLTAFQRAGTFLLGSRRVERRVRSICVMEWWTSARMEVRMGGGGEEDDDDKEEV